MAPFTLFSSDLRPNKDRLLSLSMNTHKILLVQDIRLSLVIIPKPIPHRPLLHIYTPWRHRFSIHSFIPYISTAPLQVSYYSEALLTSPLILCSVCWS